jgi:uncharacterized membrane protein SpoIIM required for sporulation
MSVRDDLEKVLRSLEGHNREAPSPAALRSFPGLYRGLVAELAEARARGAPRHELGEMEGLVLRAHAILYAPSSVRLGRAFWELVGAFPAQVWRSGRLLALATALLITGMTFGYLEVRRDPSSAAVLLPEGLRDNAEEAFRGSSVGREGDPIHGAFYFTNNANVALRAYALGGTFGVGTVLVLLFNGVVVGSTFAVVSTVGSTAAFWSFVLPHGGVELFAILVAAAGGLELADGLLRPGWMTRREAFTRAARHSLPLALGATVLLAVAGLVEGWISPQPWPLAAKAAIGLCLDLLLAAYLLLWREGAGRRARYSGVPR